MLSENRHPPGHLYCTLAGTKVRIDISMNNMQIGALLHRSAKTTAFSHNHPYEFLPSVLPLRSCRVPAVSGKHQETLSAPFPGGDLICERCLCNSIFQRGPAGHTVWSKHRKKTSEKETEREDRGTMETKLWIVGYWPYHAYTYHAGFSVRCLSAGWCYWNEDLTEGSNKQIYIQIYKNNTIYSILGMSID